LVEFLELELENRQARGEETDYVRDAQQALSEAVDLETELDAAISRLREVVKFLEELK
jgi:hypothetical protein